MRIIKQSFYLCALMASLMSCKPSTFIKSDSYPNIFPDYTEVTIPEGMAPLTFRMADSSRFTTHTEVVGDTLWTTVRAWKKGSRTGVEYKPFPIITSHDPIDPYIAYRLIEPGYESWHDMGIYQRELATFKESAIVTNKANKMGCVNCHTFYEKNPERMLFHARGEGGGTVIADGGDVKKVNLAEIGPKRQGTYPSWHPDGRYVAFSSNTTRQCFTIRHEQPIEVYDTESDIILYDTENESIVLPEIFDTKDTLETFPSWSSDGKKLYYCAAGNEGTLPKSRGKYHYRLMEADFENGEFTGETRTLFGDDSTSVSFPRLCGDWMMFTVSSFGTFPIWHKEADLWLLNTSTGESFPAESLNSDNTESYHSWSSNGRWVIFSSRRIDGRYTRLYIAHHDGEGHFGKPFLLPQKNPDLNQLRLKSYNIPEFMTEKSRNRQDSVKELFE
jgi:Periplasmic component of the Tol biopolymer transport system